MTPASPGRRALLVRAGGLAVAVTGAGLLTGCTGDEDAPSPAPGPGPDAEPLRRARADEERLIALYAGAAQRLPALAARLTALRDDHVAHLAALDELAAPSPGATPGPDTGAGTSPVPGATPAPGAPGRSATLRLLARAEDTAADTRLADLPAASPAVRRLLAGIGAAEAAHSALLRAEEP
ncbi:hypothetical protein [Motilibacter aurantiacus]|uniref:hypothetical protein n=1 Tax=Motilibacter aurantiacus TaxID=2714955 RepID=UPI00140C6637|nr:hypothetical protein [Motilibacter aurantiacus]NHC44603.1 hypothetical protein [Motilibacter aurantiacus]